MGVLLNLAIGAAAGVAALGMSAASADQRTSSGVSLSVSVGSAGYSPAAYRGRDPRHVRGGSYRPRNEVLKRRVFDIRRQRAQVVLIEEIVYYDRGRSNLVCTIDVRGPDARRVPPGQVRSIAARECSRRALVRYV